MICPHCKKKITGLIAEQVFVGDADLYEDGDIQIEQGESTYELDKESGCHIKFPRYLCSECGGYITSYDNVAKKILKEAEEN